MVPLCLSTYVDDVNCHHTTTQNIQVLTINMAHDFEHWKHLLSSSGGKRSRAKYNYHIKKGLSEL
jgi:hypothetical protein